MSLIPADKSESGNREGGDEDAVETSTSLVGRVAGRVARGVGRALGRLLPGSRGGGTPDREEENTDGAGTTALVASDGDDSDTTALEVDASIRVGPGTGPPEPDEPDERAELAAHLDDGELTLELPDESGAHITSDCWEEVER
jgi:hypothetical protein